MIVPCCGVGRYSVVSAVSGRSLVMLDLPIIVVTGPHDQAEAAESGWDQGYKNFKFRCREAEAMSPILYFLIFISLQAEEKFEGTRGGGGAKGGEAQARQRLHRQYKRCGESAEDEAQAEKETT